MTQIQAGDRVEGTAAGQAFVGTVVRGDRTEKGQYVYIINPDHLVGPSPDYKGVVAVETGRPGNEIRRSDKPLDVNSRICVLYFLMGMFVKTRIDGHHQHDDGFLIEEVETEIQRLRSLH